MSRPLAICVFCSSSTKVDPVHFATAQELGQIIAASGHRLVYGGASVGMMGELARSVKQHGGHITGIIPGHLSDLEIEFTGSNELIRTPCIRTRKAEMELRSDAFLVLPGGIGTLEEMFEVLTQRLLNQHQKPVVIINSHGFYDGLLAFMDHLHDTRFNREKTRGHYHVVRTPREAMEKITHRDAVSGH